MTRDDIIKLAREAGLLDFSDAPESAYVQLVLADFERFATLVAAAEREACARVCTEIMDDFWTGDDRWETARHCAETIRARSSK